MAKTYNDRLSRGSPENPPDRASRKKAGVAFDLVEQPPKCPLVVAFHARDEIPMVGAPLPPRTCGQRPAQRALLLPITGGKISLAAGDLTAAERERQRAQRHEADCRQGHAIGAEWARQRGYADLDAYAAASGMRYEFAACEVIKSILAACDSAKPFGCGPTARRFSPTPERLAAGRRQLELFDDA